MKMDNTGHKNTLPLPDPTFGLTLRLRLSNRTRILARIIATIKKAGGSVSAIDLVSASETTITRDFLVHPMSEAQGQRLLKELTGMSGVEVLNISDQTLLTHLGGKLEIISKQPIRTAADLAILYTPGVNRVCRTVAEHPEKIWGLTSKRNLVAVVSDGSAVLGLGNIGPAGALPALEANSQIFKIFGGVDAFPLCLTTQDAGEIIETLVRIAPSFGGISLVGLSSPRCFEITEKLQALLEMPVYHDDQHGTSVVVLAALINACRVTGRKLKECSVVLSGVGASGVGVAKLLLHMGVNQLIGCDTAGAIYKGRRENMNSIKEWFAEHTNPKNIKGTVDKALRKADVFIGLSGPGTVKPAHIKAMANDSIVFSLASPKPEVDPEKIQFAGVIATGRTDYANYVNNALAFPGIMRGCLDVRASAVNIDMLASAAGALADVIPQKKLQRGYIIPSLFNTDVARNVAAAVWESARKTRVARRSASSDYHDGHF
ncbi:MAG: NAD-dependent malic enzyme [Elusimicrobiota bacterium]